jgi:hypothetical protein
MLCTSSGRPQDTVGRFEYDGHTDYGLYEYWALGDHPSFR